MSFSRRFIALKVRVDYYICKIRAVRIGRTDSSEAEFHGGLADLDWNVTRRTKKQLDLHPPSIDWLHALPKMDYVFCCAEFGGIVECKRNQLATHTVNVLGMIRVLEALRDTMTAPVYLSSNMVFPGERVDDDESDVRDPQTSYGRQKLKVEDYIR